MKFIRKHWRELLIMPLGLVLGWYTRSLVIFCTTIMIGEIIARGTTHIPETFARPFYSLGQYQGCAPQGLHFRLWPWFSWGNLIDLSYRPMKYMTPKMPSSDCLPVSAEWELMYRFLPWLAPREVAAELIRFGPSAPTMAVRNTLDSVTLHIVRIHTGLELMSGLGQLRAEAQALDELQASLRGVGIEILRGGVVLTFQPPLIMQKALVDQQAAPAAASAQTELANQLIQLIRHTQDESERRFLIEILRTRTFGQNGTATTWEMLLSDLGDFLQHRGGRSPNGRGHDQEPIQ